MATLTPSQRRWRGRIEIGIAMAAPVLDFVLYVGDRFSRIVEREQPEATDLDESFDDGR